METTGMITLLMFRFEIVYIYTKKDLICVHTEGEGISLFIHFYGWE